MKKSLLKFTLGIAVLALGLKANAQCPTITCPTDTVINNDQGSCDAIFNFGVPAGIDFCASGSQTFSYTGVLQTFTVPAGVTMITIQAYGAQGGDDTPVAGGQGGYATGDLAVTPGQVLNIYVGGKGTDGPGSGQNCALPGGFNGGGNTGATCCSNAGGGAGAGGGASDVRLAGNTLNDRVIVAAGGGGAGDGQVGAVGGGLIGANGGTYNGVTSTGGTQTAGGLAGGTFFPNHTCSPATDGTFGQGGEGDGNDGGGGGGGWYGGGGGANNSHGAGGSSYIGGVTNSSTTSGGRVGNGEIIISYLGAAVSTSQTLGLGTGVAYPIGVTTNTYVATNNFGSATCSFNVTVVDVEAPIISCPSDTTVCDTTATIINNIAPITSDNCSGETVTYTLSGATTGSGTGDASGTTFNNGITTVKYIVADAVGNLDSCSFNVEILTCVGIKEVYPLQGIEVFPNPVKDFIQVSFEENYTSLNLTLTSVEGKIIYQKNNVTSKKVTIDVAGFDNGIYFLQVTNGLKSNNYKIVKK